MLIPRLEIEAAASRIRADLAITRLVRADHFSRKLGANVFFKLETLQPTHSFKERGFHVPESHWKMSAIGLQAFVKTDDDFNYSFAISDTFCFDPRKDACRLQTTNSCGGLWNLHWDLHPFVFE